MTQTAPRHAAGWKLRGRTLPLGARALVMGVLNVTPDSFIDPPMNAALK